MPMNRAEGALETGVMEKRLEAQAAPSGSLVVTAGRRWEMTLFKGRAKPSRPWNDSERGSSMTMLAAAVLVF
jgi:hypothetical protein